MIKIISIYLVIAIGFSWFFPWWSLILIAIITGFILRTNEFKKIGRWGFVLTGLIWLGMALTSSWLNGFELAERLTKTFTLPHVSLFFVIQFLIGGIIGGSGFLFGSKSREYFKKQSI